PNTSCTTTPPGRTAPLASSHRAKLTPGHRNSTSPSTGSDENKSSEASPTNTRSPHNTPRHNEQSQVTAVIEYSSPTGSADAATKSWAEPSSGTRPICGGSCTTTRRT